MNVPYDFGIHQDNKDSTKYVADIVQGGLGMPDRDYYLKADDAKLADDPGQVPGPRREDADAGRRQERRRQCQGRSSPSRPKSPRCSGPRSELRDPIKAYNKVELAELDKVAPGLRLERPSWTPPASAGKASYVIVSQPTYLKSFAELSANDPAGHLEGLSADAPDRRPTPASCRKAFVDERFDFYGTTLSGVTEMRAALEAWRRRGRSARRARRWASCTWPQYFPAERKARMEALVKNLLAAYKRASTSSTG